MMAKLSELVEDICNKCTVYSNRKLINESYTFYVLFSEYNLLMKFLVIHKSHYNNLEVKFLPVSNLYKIILY